MTNDCSTLSKLGGPCRSQAGGNDARLSGEDQQASATRATITMVAEMGSIAFSRLDSPSIRWLGCTTPFTGESVVNLMRVPT